VLVYASLLLVLLAVDVRTECSNSSIILIDSLSLNKTERFVLYAVVHSVKENQS